jgi:Putative transmembrane protein (PGPGW)
MATLGAGLRLAARPAEKSATPSVAAEPSAAEGERRGFRPPIVAFLYARNAMAPPEQGWFGKARDLHQRSHPVLRRVVVAVVGFVLIGVGVLLLVLPGPGLLLIAAGVAVLSLEFEWAGRLVERARALIDRLRRRGG